MINDLIQEDKTYFVPGQIVEIRQDIPNKPRMIVVRKESSIIKSKDGKELLKGIKTRWFTKDGQLQEAVWNTKDLILIK